MSEEIRTLEGFSRRSFIKGAAILTASCAATWNLAGCEGNGGGGGTVPGQVGDQIFSGACRGNCGGGCFLNIHVRDNQVVRTSARDLPNPE